MNTEQTSSFSERELQFIVGRDRELGIFKQELERVFEKGESRLLHLYGTGGVGKSTLLRLFRRAAAQWGALYFQLDSRDFIHTEQGIAGALLSRLGVRAEGTVASMNQFYREIQRQTEEPACILAVDTFEEMQNMESWLRERLVHFLPRRVLLVFAGRHPLRGGWLLSPVWRERIRQIPIAHLEKNACTDYLNKCGILNELEIERIWKRTMGHPLALSLAAATRPEAAPGISDEGLDWFGELAALWMQEVLDEELRRHVEAAAVIRIFDQEKLSYIMGNEVRADVYDRLASLSFVRKSDRGLQLHDLMRESASTRFKERAPQRYRRMVERSAAYFANAILTSSDRSGMEWEVGELFRYADVDVLRALITDQESGTYYWETASESTLRDAEAYARWRERNTQGVSGVEIDPVTGQSFAIEYTAEQVKYNAAPVDLEPLYKLDPTAIRLLRDQEDRACALGICIPIHSVTLPWLQQDPLFLPYWGTLTKEERNNLMTPADRPSGWFLRSFDFMDVLNPALRTSAIYLIYSFLCRGGLVVCTPFDTEIGRKAYTAFGFSVVEGATHCNYDGVTPTPTYALDTRGEKLTAFLHQLIRQGGLEWEAPLKSTGKDTEAPSVVYDDPFQLLSERERDVALQILSGCSNAEVARNLVITESTVKKHLKSIYAKLNISSRTQLALKLLARP